MYCTPEDVTKLSGIKAKSLGFKDNKTEFDSLIEEWIEQAEGLINSYCNRKFETDSENTVPLAVKNVCIRLVSNMIAFHISRGDKPIKKVNDYTTKIYSSEVFTQDLKQDLKPFKKSSKVKVFKI